MGSETQSDCSADQMMLRALFNRAAAMSLSVANSLDAEDDMMIFVRAVELHPHEREFIVGLFDESLSESFVLTHAPVELWRFVCHYFRWDELRRIIQSSKDEDVGKRGAARSSVWDYILEAFNDNWDAAGYFRVFGRK